MRPRMYGSRLMKWWRTSTWPSCSGGVSLVTSLKLEAVASPCGRLSRRIWRFFGMACLLSVGRDDVELLRALGPDRQARHVLEGAGGMRAGAAGFIVDGGFGEG